jgi:hypothetical protein
MSDVDRELRDSLSRYAASIVPSAPGDLADLAARLERSRVRAPAGVTRRWIAAVAAAALIAALFPAMLLLRHESAATTPAPTSSISSQLGSWEVIPVAPLSPRKLPSVVWTGDEFIVWGGSDGNPHPLADGAAYDPATRTWRTIAPTTRAHPGANAVWAGDRLVVLAGDSGDAYDPVTDSWSPLPTLDRDAGAGFNDAVWTGEVLLGVGVDLTEQGDQATLSVWRLDDDATAWTLQDRRVIRSGLPATRRFVSVADQFHVFDPIPTDTGFVLWGAAEGGWQYHIDDGWSQLPPLEPRPGRSLDDTTVAWLNGQLVAVGSSTSADDSDFELAEFDQGEWSALRSVADVWVGFPHAIVVDDRIVILGVNGATPTGEPLLVDPAGTTAIPMNGYPLDTTLDQGTTWSGTSLFIWGGQSPSDSDEHTTSDPGPISNQGALWTP